MGNVENVRNFTIAAQVDAGKSTFSDSMLAYAGLINKDEAGDKVTTDTMKIEQEKGITIKSVGVSMLFDSNEQKYVMNMIDSPGHIDFSAEVTAAVRVSDGVFVLLDPLDGVMAQTKTVLIQSLEERVVPCLLINKMDKFFLSLKATPDDIYAQLVKNVQDVNRVIDDYQDPKMKEIFRDQKVDPIKGNVMFGSAYHTWGFTLKTFAKIYAPKLNLSIETTMRKLWEPKNFCNLIIKPIYTVINACQSYPLPGPDGKDLKTLLETLKINMKPTDFELSGKALLRKVMGTWLPIGPSAVEMAVDQLPSPKFAQTYRVDLLYKGVKKHCDENGENSTIVLDEQDEYYKSIKNCDPNGPLVVYISKMVPTKDNSHFYAFGRVFSGTVKSMKILVLHNEHDPTVQTHHKTYLKDSIQRVVLMMANRIESIDTVPAGNIMALDGIDKTMIKSGTIVDENSQKSFPLHNMDFSVSPIVRYALVPKSMGDIAKFTETLRKFVKSDPCLQYMITEEGEHLLCGAGELHLETSIEILKSDFLKNIEFTVSEPIVPYCETVTEMSRVVCLAKSPNKHNRLFCRAEPINDKLVNEMIEGDLPKDPKERARYLIDNYGYDESARKIWSFAPEVEPANMVMDMTKGVQYLNEIKDNVCAGFIAGSSRGPLCEEPLRGVKLNLEDVVLHADTIHRGGGQIIPTVRNVLYASILSASARLMEPVFKAEIQLPREKVSTIYGLMSKRRGTVGLIAEEANGNMVKLEAELPVAESFGFVEDLRGVTSGTAFASLCFSHWQIVPGDPMDSTSYAYQILMKIRKRKGLKLELPKFEEYNDKL
jgi:elongation factor 2